jgi:hypothetical protein
MMGAPTPYPDINHLLRIVLEGAYSILGKGLAGFYLNGSLVSGDFDPAHSDVDFVAVTTEHLPEPLVDRLVIMHRAITTCGLPFSAELEGSYIPVNSLRRHDPAAALFPNLERGPGETLQVKEHHSDWVIQRHIVREHGLALLGPPPETLIDPVSADELRRATAAVLHSWWSTPGGG